MCLGCGRSEPRQATGDLPDKTVNLYASDYRQAGNSISVLFLIIHIFGKLTAQQPQFLLQASG
jgi:hypothetical protein